MCTLSPVSIPEPHTSPDYWKAFTKEHELIGVVACLSEREDLSGVGVDLQFLTEEQAAQELTECWPGIGVAADGYMPVAQCFLGSGDYYYINRADGPNGPLYRIYHDSVGPGGYDRETAVDRVLDDYALVLDGLER